MSSVPSVWKRSRGEDSSSEMGVHFSGWGGEELLLVCVLPIVGSCMGSLRIGSRCWHEYVIELGDVDGCNYGGSRRKERYLALKFEAAINSF